MPVPSIHNKIEELERQVKSLMARVNCNRSRARVCDPTSASSQKGSPNPLGAVNQEQKRILQHVENKDRVAPDGPETDGSQWGEILNNVSYFVHCLISQMSCVAHRSIRLQI